MGISLECGYVRQRACHHVLNDLMVSVKLQVPPSLFFLRTKTVRIGRAPCSLL